MRRTIQELVKKSIIELKPYTSARDLYTESKGVFLDANESPFGTYNRYPDPYQVELKNRICQLKGVDSNRVFLGNGSDEIIDLAFRIFCKSGVDKALIFTPTYGMYSVVSQVNDIELLQVELNENFQIVEEQLSELLTIENLKLILLCSPNNPTGNALNRSTVERILKSFDGIVIIDEAYIDFAETPSFLNDLAQYPNLIVSQTLSKAWGLAAIRLGMAFMSPEILTFFNKVKHPYNISLPNQQLALEALNDINLYMERVELIKVQREILLQELQELNLIRKVYPSDANFLLVEVEDADTLYEQLLESNIVIRNRNAEIENCVRISVGTPEENKQLLNRLKELSNG